MALQFQYTVVQNFIGEKNIEEESGGVEFWGKGKAMVASEREGMRLIEETLYFILFFCQILWEMGHWLIPNLIDIV